MPAAQYGEGPASRVDRCALDQGGDYLYALVQWWAVHLIFFRIYIIMTGYVAAGYL